MWRQDKDRFKGAVPAGAQAEAANEITNWRERQLVRNGFDRKLAANLAADREIDLHALLELVDRGCPPRLAGRILAPLDRESPPC